MCRAGVFAWESLSCSCFQVEIKGGKLARREMPVRELWGWWGAANVLFFTASQLHQPHEERTVPIGLMFTLEALLVAVLLTANSFPWKFPSLFHRHFLNLKIILLSSQYNCTAKLHYLFFLLLFFIIIFSPWIAMCSLVFFRVHFLFLPSRLLYLQRSLGASPISTVKSLKKLRNNYSNINLWLPWTAPSTTNIDNISNMQTHF